MTARYPPFGPQISQSRDRVARYRPASPSRRGAAAAGASGTAEASPPPSAPQIGSVRPMHPAGLPPLGRKMRPGGVLLFNSTLVKSPPAWDGVRLLGIPATAMAEGMGQVVGAAM